MKYIVQPNGLPAGSGWSHVAVGTGTFAAISGQVSVDQSGAIVGKDDPEAQVRQVYENLRLCLDGLGASFADVVKINYYAVDIATVLPIMRRLRPEYIDPQYMPANTFIGVPALAHADFLFEAEAFVLLPSSS